MSLVIKAFLERNNDSRAEIRRFTVPTDASASYTYIFKKVSEVFPGLVTGHFNLYWKDSDGDLVSFSSDDELMEALGFVNDSVLRIYIKEHASSSSNDGSNDVLHPGVVCDNCNGVVRGVRYKCSVCPDFDLCSGCWAKKPHPMHEMCKIDSPFISCGPGNMPFRPPPYFRRWMKRYMNRWHSKNTGGSGTEQNEPTCGTQEDGGEKEDTSPEEEFPQGMGDFAALMDPFAIHMGFNMDNGEPRHGGGMHGRHGWRGGWGGWGRFRGHGHGQGQGHCHRRRGQCQRAAYKDAEMKETGDNRQQCCDESAPANEVPPCTGPEGLPTDGPVSDKMKDLQLNENGCHRTDRDGGWTMLSS